MERLNVCVIGYGTVGKSVVEILEGFNDIDVKYIVIKDQKNKCKKNMTIDYEKVINDESVKVVLEMINGDAYDYIVKALKAKKSVISSNKLTICKHLKEYTFLAKKNKVSLLFDASVCGGIPIISNIYKYKRIDPINSLYGIMNGTCNFILDLMNNFDFDFEKALEKAKLLGYAEKDPSSDIMGLDVLRKIIIASEVAYDVSIKSNEVFFYGINNIKKAYLDFLKEHGYTLKLLGYSSYKKASLTIHVMPTALKNSNVMSHVNSNLNMISLNTNSIGDLSMIGQGAGGLATANQMINDLLDFKENKVFEIPDFQEVKLDNLEVATYYIFNNLELFENVKFKVENNVLQTKKITIKQLEEYAKKAKNLFFARIEE